MLIEKNTKVLEEFLNISLSEFERIHRIIDSSIYEDAVKLILEAEGKKGRVHVTGIGKPGHVAGYVASLLSSTGTPAYTLDGTEAVHGSAGQVVPGDVVIAISNSGETEELKATVQTLKDNGAKIISVSGNPNSWLVKNGDAFLYAGVKEEGDPLNMAPRASIIAEIFVLQGLSIALQSVKQLTHQQYIKWHPGGSLGKRKES
ncbi:SIS domain-containing protein [Bacillaceae bacterium Marseille-Q3522]|nr:SIS domain-containing protein [Bacillaceae bacterium Marseille-Q3522]